MKGSDFIFDCVDLFHHKCHRINFSCDASYMDSLEVLSIKKYSKCFQYALTMMLSYEKIKMIHKE